MDLTGLLRAGNSIPIPLDTVMVELRRTSDSSVAYSKSVPIGQFTQAADSLIFRVDLQLRSSPEQFYLFAEARGGGIVYYTVNSVVTASSGAPSRTPPLTPTYIGPGATADSVRVSLASASVAAGDSVLATAVVYAGQSVVPGVPVGIVSADSIDVDWHPQGVDQAWLVAAPGASGPITISAKTPTGLTSATTLTVLPAAAGLVKVSGDAQQLATGAPSQPLVVQLLDGQGQPFTTGKPVSFALTTVPAGTTITPSSTVSDSLGFAQAIVTAGSTAGNAVVTVSSGSLPPVTFTLTIASGASGPAAVAANSPVTQTRVVNQLVTSAPSVLVTDSASQPIAGVAVTFAVTAGGGALTGASATTNASGVATVGSWRVGQTVGTNTVTATVTGLPPVSFSATGTPTVLTTLVKDSGDAQTDSSLKALPVPLVVQAQDSFGNVLSGTTVTWTVSDGSVLPVSGSTDAQGRTRTVWTLGSTQATPTATATAGAVQTIFTATTLFGLPTIQLSFASVPGVGIGLTAKVYVTLNTPAPAGGKVVTVASGNTSFFTVAPGSVTIPAGQTRDSVTITGVGAGQANLNATATGYAAGSLAVDVQNRNISVPPTLNVPYGQTASLPIQLPAPAPAGGVTFTVVSSAPGSVGVSTPTVTIPAGGQTANATLDGILPGPATITVSNPSYLDGITAATTTASLNIVQSSVNPNGSFGTPVTINFESNGIATAAPSPGITVSLVSANSACAIGTTPVTIPTGLVSTTATISYGGSAALPCSTTITAQATNLQQDVVNVTVSPLPGISVGAATVGSGLQDNTSFTLGAANHGGVTVTLTSSDPAVLLSPNATTAGTSSITIPVPNGTQSVGYYVQGLEGRVADTVVATVTVSAPGFNSGTALVTAVQGAIDLQGLPATTTTLSPSSALYARLGVPNSNGSALQALQNLRAGSPLAPVTTTFDVIGNGQGELLKKATPPGPTQTALIPLGVNNTPTDTTSGGVAFHPLSAGTVAVAASIPTFISTTAATRTIVISQPGITLSPVTVGSGLQENTSFFLAAPNHGNITVTLTSSDTAVLLSPNSTTPGALSITIPVLDGVQSVGFYVQGLEGRVTDTVVSTVTVSAPGFSNGTANMTAVQGAIDLQGLPSSTTSLSPSNAVYARLGLPQAGNAALQALQNLRAGSPLAPVTVTFATQAGGVGELLKKATPAGLTQTADIPLGVNNTPTDTTSGGVFFHPLGAGSTTVSATLPGFISTTSATRSISVSQPGISVGALTVGSGLQDNTSFTLGASNHGGVTVVLTSSDPAIMLSPNATTAGTSSISIPVPNGTQTVGFYAQALEGRVGDTVVATVTATAPGFSNGSSSMVAVQGAIDLQGLPGTTSTLSPSNMIYARLGLPQAGNAALQALQNLRAGSPLAPVTVTFTTPGNGIGELLKKATPAGASQTAQIPLAVNNTPTDTTSGGVGFHPLLAGTTTVSATLPGFISTTAATRSITASQPGISVGSLTVGSGLQDNTSFTLGAPNHGPLTVTLTSSNPAVLLAPNATTPGTASISIPVADLVQTVGFYAQGLEGQVSSVTATVTVSAPGFTNGTSTVTVVQPALDLQGLPSSTTPLSPSNMIYARIGIAQAGNGALQALQNMRAGSTLAPLTVTFTSPANGIGELLKAATPAGASQTATIPLAVNNTPTDTSTGGVAFHPLSGTGTTTVSATIPGFVATTAATRSITSAAPGISVGSLTVGSGLQENTSFTLGAPNHGGVTVTLTSSSPVILISPNASTPGATSITIPVANGTQTVGFYIQGLEGQTSGTTGNITVSAPGFVTGSANETVLQAALDLQGVPTTIATGAADAGIYVRVGTTTSPGNASLNTVQQVRAGIPGGALTVTFTTSNPGAANLLTTASGLGTTQTVQIPTGQSNTPTNVASGGVGLRPIAPGSASITATIPTVITTGTGTRPVTVQ